MRIGIDVRAACSPKRTGKGQWTYRFIDELLTRGKALTLYTDAALPEAWQRIVDGSGGDIQAVHLSFQGLRWHLETAKRLKRNADKLDAYVSPVSYIVPAFVGKMLPVIPVVHDLIAFRNEPHDRKATFIEKLTLGRAMNNAAAVCTISDATSKDLLARYPRLPMSRVHPIYAGTSWEQTIVRDPLPANILSIGTLCPRKNQLRLIQAFASLPSPLREQATLTLVGGRGWNDDEIVKLAKETSGVTWHDYLPDEECARLLSRCTVFALPSLYEGFGLTVLDAMAQGVPVLTSDRGSLAEVAGDAALMCDPEDVAAIREGLVKLLTDGQLRTSLAIAGPKQALKYSWKNTVDRFQQTLADIDKGAL